MRVEISHWRAINQGALKSACTVELHSEKDGHIMDICGVKLMEGRDGPFVSMPAEKGRDLKWYSLVFIKHQGLKQAIQDAVLAHESGGETAPSQTQPATSSRGF